MYTPVTVHEVYDCREPRLGGVLCAPLAPAARVFGRGPAQGRVRLNTGAEMPLVNCGGTAQ